MKRLSIGPRFYNAANRTRTPNGCEHAPMPDVLMGAKLLSRRCPSNLDAIGWNRNRKPPRILVRQRISFRCFDQLRYSAKMVTQIRLSPRITLVLPPSYYLRSGCPLASRGLAFRCSDRFLARE